MTAQAVLERPVETGESVSFRTETGSDEFRRAVLSAVLERRRATFAVEAQSAASVLAAAAPVRSFLMLMSLGQSGVSATVAPRFSEDTYAAMLDLARRLDEAGAGDLWRPVGLRMISLGEARHVFVSADMPVAERSPNPDRLLEVVESHRLPYGWYQSRVAPRARASSLVQVFYGRDAGSRGSVYEAMSARAATEEALGGGRRRFVLD